VRVRRAGDFGRCDRHEISRREAGPVPTAESPKTATRGSSMLRFAHRHELDSLPDRPVSPTNWPISRSAAEEVEAMAVNLQTELAPRVDLAAVPPQGRIVPFAPPGRELRSELRTLGDQRLDLLLLLQQQQLPPTPRASAAKPPTNACARRPRPGCKASTSVAHVWGTALR
jgi:hypothetical protein